MNFENPQKILNKPEQELESFDLKQEAGREVGVLRKIANTPFAKKMVLGMGLMTVVLATELGAAGDAEARSRHKMAPDLAEVFKGKMQNLKSLFGVDEGLAKGKEISRGVRRYEREKERANRAAGKAEFERRLRGGENFYAPLVDTMQSGALNPDVRDEYNRCVKRYERRQRMEQRNAAREAGRQQGKERLKRNGY